MPINTCNGSIAIDMYSGDDTRKSTTAAPDDFEIEQPKSTKANTNVRVYLENQGDASESNRLQFKDNTGRSIDIVKFFEEKYRNNICNNLKQLITNLESSQSAAHVIYSVDLFNQNLSNEISAFTSLNEIRLPANITDTDFDNSKNKLITELKDLLASYQVTVLEKQEKTESNIELKKNNVFFIFFNSVTKLLTRFITFVKQIYLLNKVLDAIDEGTYLNETELKDLIHKLNQSSLDKALLYNAGQGNVEIIDMLVKAGADVNTKGWCNCTPLISALREGRYVAAKKLLESKPNVNTMTIGGYTALTAIGAAELKNNSTDDIIYEISDYIIDNSSDRILNYQNYDGFVPLLYAVSYGNLHIVKKLLERNVSACGNYEMSSGSRWGVLHAAIFANNIDIETKIKIIKELLNAGIRINTPDGKGRTALEFAKLQASSCQDYKPIVELLERHKQN